MKPATLLILALLCFAACDYRRDPDSPYFGAIAKNDLPLPPAQPGDWRHEHNEKQQSFTAYRRASATTHTDSSEILLFLPIGVFTPMQMQLLEDVREYNTIFFQRDIRLLPVIGDSTIPSSGRRFRDDGHEQLQASWIIDTLLPNLRQESTFGIMAITALDLYPQPEWNFVFGLANYHRRVGISSIYRLQDEQLWKGNYNSCLLRLNKIVSHEVAHMLKLNHCLNAQCVMNGTNSLTETDRNPARACSFCQQKLHENLGFDLKRRLEGLAGYFTAHGLPSEAALCKKDLGVIGGLLD